MGLNDEYRVVKTQILSSTLLPALGIAYHLVSQDRQQIIVGMNRHSAGKAAAFQTSGKVGPNPQRKEISQNSTKKKNKDLWCTNCQKSGHTMDVCFEIIGYPE